MNITMFTVVVNALIPGTIAAVIAYLISRAQTSHKMGVLEGTLNSAVDNIRRLDAKLENLNTRIDRVLTHVMIGAMFHFASGKEKDEITNRTQPDREKFLEFIDEISKQYGHKKNPITIEEIERLRTYRNKIAHLELLTPSEYQDFQFLVQKVKAELPEERRGEFDWVAGAVLGFVAGLIIGSLLSR